MLPQLRLDQAVHAISTYVFTQQGNPEPMHPQFQARYMQKFSKKYDVPGLHPHKLRHTYASLMIADGLPLVVVSRQLGHAQASTTANIYAHTIASAQAKAMQTFDRFNDIVGTEKPPEKGMKKAAGN